MNLQFGQSAAERLISALFISTRVASPGTGGPSSKLATRVGSLWVLPVSGEIKWGWGPLPSSSPWASSWRRPKQPGLPHVTVAGCKGVWRNKEEAAHFLSSGPRNWPNSTPTIFHYSDGHTPDSRGGYVHALLNGNSKKKIGGTIFLNCHAFSSPLRARNLATWNSMDWEVL